MNHPLMDSVTQRAVELRVPLLAHVDLTYGCNQDCVHCYLHHSVEHEMSTVQVKDVLTQLADAGTLFLILSGGEIFLRDDALDVIAFARKLNFSVKIKSNGTLVSPVIADRLRELSVQSVDVSVYAADSAIHDRITRLRGSLEMSLNAIARLQRAGVHVRIANVLMRENTAEAGTVRQLAVRLGVGYSLDPTVTPMIDGDVAVLQHQAEPTAVGQAFRDFGLSGRNDELCQPANAGPLEEILCSAGHCQVYISPRGQVFPCVQFPVECGDLRVQKFTDIWQSSPVLQQIRSLRFKDLPICSKCSHGSYCTRCPGLAWMEGDILGLSSIDCRKSEARSAESGEGVKPNQLR